MFETYEDMVTIDDVCQMLNIGKKQCIPFVKGRKASCF